MCTLVCPCFGDLGTYVDRVVITEGEGHAAPLLHPHRPKVQLTLKDLGPMVHHLVDKQMRTLGYDDENKRML